MNRIKERHSTSVQIKNYEMQEVQQVVSWKSRVVGVDVTEESKKIRKKVKCGKIHVNVMTCNS